MKRTDLAGISDGGTLRRLPSGLEIVRRRKHEPVDLQGRPRSERERLTGKRFGSKFLETWDLARLTHWIAHEVAARGWRVGPAEQADVRLDELVGVANGELARTIRIMSDGRYVHAFPVEDGS